MLVDPRDETLPSVGRVRVRDPEAGGRELVLDTGSASARAAYAAAWQRSRARPGREIRRGGGELLWLRTDRSPLHALGRFFHDRAARRLRSAA